MENNKKYKTHWHSFWFGFMCALATVLFVLLLFTVTEKITFNQSTQKNVSVSDVSENVKKEVISEKNINTSLEDTAEKLDINREEFTTCMQEGRHTQTVQDNIDSGAKAGVEGTPHSFVLIDDAIYEIPGAQDESGMREFFDDLLADNDPRATDISAEREIAQVDENDWIIGDENARITVIEYSDIDCPFSQKFHDSTANMRTDYADDVRWIFRHMPIDGLHPDARAKAEAAECAGEIGGGVSFWKYLDTLFK